jgi:hypothetical protein
VHGASNWSWEDHARRSAAHVLAMDPLYLARGRLTDQRIVAAPSVDGLVECFARPGYLGLSPNSRLAERWWLAIGIAEKAQRLFIRRAIAVGGWEPWRVPTEELSRLTSVREYAYRDATPWHGEVLLVILEPGEPGWTPPQGHTAVVRWRTSRELIVSALQVRMLDELARWPI